MKELKFEANLGYRQEAIRAIVERLDKELALKGRGIKVLSLFFRQEDGPDEESRGGKREEA